MRGKNKRLISLAAAISMLGSLVIVPETVQAEDLYSCNFKQLVKDGMDTAYGTGNSVIQLDEYTTAYLTYEGTYVSADGKVYLRSDTVCNGNGRYAKGSYIAFTAPSDGTITVTGADLGWFEGDVYKGYNSSITIDAVGGTTYNFGYRKTSTYIDSLTFSPSESGGETEIPTEEPGGSEGDTVPVYESPLSSWDFNAYAPAAGGVNVPYISGNAEYDSENGEVKFPSGTTASGYLTIDFEKPVRNNVEISFDYAGHTKALGNQFINYRIVNSEGEEIVSFSGHPYSSDAVYGSNTLTVCGTASASGDAVRNLVSGVGTPITIKTAIDYNARKVTVTAGDSVLTGEISESAAKDIAKIEISGTRSKTEASRYMSIDNLCVSEFDSTEPSAPAGDIANDYEEKTFGRFASRVNTPEESGLPLVVYLCGESRFGTDNYSQLYNAQPLFDLLKGKAVLAAPQTESGWNADLLKAYISEAKAEYNAASVTVAGQSEGAAAAYALAANGAADKIIPIAGTSDISGNVNAAVWAFGGFLDTNVPVSDIRKPVNALQSAGANVRYTEYPEDGHNIADKAAAEPGLTEWILNDTDDKKVVDLVLFAGQSNMAGRGTAAEAVVCPSGAGYELHIVGNAKLADGEVPYVLSTVTEPFGKNENNDIIHDAGSNGIDRRSGDMVPAFMKAYYEKTGVPVVGVQASRGGQETRWFVTADVKTEMARRYNDAAAYLEKAGYTVRKKFMVWCQGEGDADNNRSQSVYKGNTLDIFNNMKSAGVTDMFIVKTGHYNINYGLSDGAEPSADALEKDARYKNVNTWQQELADENDNVYTVADLYTDSSLAQMRDQYHYYQPVYNEIGTTAGAAAAAVYGDETVPTEKPTDKPGVNYSWDLSTDQTASSGNNIPVLSGTAAYSAEHQNIRLTAGKTTDDSVSVNFSPAVPGVVTADFDMNISSLSNQMINITAQDENDGEILRLSLDTYNNLVTVTIGGEAVCVSEQAADYFNKAGKDGMSAAATHFNIVINTARHTAEITMAKSGAEGKTYKGMIPSGITAAGRLQIARVCANSSGADRHCYVDNIKISSYIPAAAIYATGAASVAKRMGMYVTEQFSLSKTYTDDSETAEWSVEGVSGVTIDKTTGMLTVAENASTGTAKVTVTLTKSGTLPTGTSDTIEVEIKDFAQPAEYTIGGSATIETGKTAQLTLEKLLDADGNDITEFAKLGNFRSNNDTVASVSEDGTVTAKKAGTAELTFTLSVDKLGYSKEIKEIVKIGAFEIVSNEAEIDVSSLVNYGSDTYRIYKADRSYTDVKSENGKVSNTTGGEVTVVPVYRFNYTTGAMDGYTDATGDYSADNGYGLLSGINDNTNENGSLPVSGRPLHIDLPYGSYDMNILRKGGARADVYNDDIQIINNTTSAGSQNRPADSALMYAPQVLITDGSADITIGNKSGANERIAAVEIVRVPDQYKKHIVWIAGDSEAANYYPIDADGDDLASDKIMMTGFGMQLGRFLSSDHYKIANWGQPSATVGTWYDECFSSVLYRMEAGDTILVDFGINDAISSSNATTIEAMKDRMKEIFDAAKAKGVQPILVSPLWNSKYQHRAYFTYNADTDSNEMYAFAKECGVPCIDLNKGTMRYKDAAIAATGDSDWAVHNYHVGDNLHQTQHSAVLNAAIIAGGMKKMGYVTTDFAETYKDISAFDASDSTKRGEESGITREYSIAALEDYITIAGEEIKIEEPTIPPALTDGITVSGKTVSVVLTDADNAVLIHSKYDSDGRLTGIKVYDLTFINGRAEQEISELAEDDELYVWDSLSGMKPLLNKAAVKSAPATAAPTETTTVTQSPSFAPTDEPSEMLYSEDFEGYSVGDKGGWTSPAGTMSIKSDSTSGIGKYQTVVSGKSGTCRSGYVELPDAIDKNFVFECDYKSSSNVNVSDLELLEAKSSVYANHGVYSNANFVFTMARPKGSDLYVINNKTDDSGLQADGYTDPVFTSKEISGNPWHHVKVVGDFDNQRVILYITSLDGKTEYLHGMYDMNVGRDKKITSWKCLHLLSPTTGADTCIDNIKVRTAVTSDLAPVYHKVRLSLGTYSFEQYVLDGESVINIPDTSLYGSSFEGWTIGADEKLYTSSALAAAPITADCEINGSISADYIEALSTVEFRDFPAGNELSMGADENTYGDNIISLAIIGEQGTSLAASPDSRVEDYKIEWEFDGFRTLDGAPTGETVTKYCDSYGLIEITEKAQSSVNFRLKRTSANYYGRVKAAVTYNGKTIEVEKPLVLLGDKSGITLLPKPGYTEDFNKYEDSMIGYSLSGGDIVTGGWASSGSDATYMKILSDSTGKYLSLSRAASGNSSYVHNEIGELTKQTVFEQDVRFGLDGTIRYIGGSTTAPTSTAFSFSKSGANLTFNGNTIYTGASSSEWYHIVITADPTSRLAYAKVYDMSGRQLGASGTVGFSAYKSGAYYEIVLDTRSNKASIDINNVRVYEPELDTNSFKITMPETAAIPESGTTEVTLSAATNTIDGDASIGLVSWMIADELAEGISIESTGTDTAKLVISSSAVSGNLPISASVGGKTVTAEIKLIGTKDNVAFVSAPAGIQLGTVSEYVYSAEVRNGNAETVSGRSITYSLANADGTAAAAAGVSIDSASGRLTVSADAKPQTVYVKAVSTDSTGSEISRLTKTVLYSLSFSFGTNAPAAGFTRVTADTAYSASKGFGIEGAAADEAEAVTGSGFTFKVKLEKGRVYNVKAKYEGTIRCERVNSDFAGFDRKKDTLGEDTYSVAVFGDDVMDITLPSAGTLASVEITPTEKKAAAKPDWWTIGDSTVQQNGSWGYTIAAEKTTDLSKYPELAAVVNGFHNSGKAGEQHKNFYTNGRLNAILTQMNPGDVVSISGMGTNDSSSSKEQFKAYDKMYMDAILDMGGRVILGSYTPTGNYGATQGKVYDADTMTFKGMRTAAYDLAIRELYEESKAIHGVLGFVDIGKMADEKMTADVQAVYTAARESGAAEEDAAAAANTRASELMALWKDYNHYYIDFSNYILPDITKAVAELIGL